MDMMRKCTRDTNNDGQIDVYGMLRAWNTWFLDSAVYTNDAEYVHQDENGKYTLAINTPQFLQAAQFVANLYKEGVSAPMPDGVQWDYEHTSFKDGQFAFMTTETWDRSQYQDMKDDWGFVVFPKGPAAKGYIAGMQWHWNYCYAIPAYFTADQAKQAWTAWYNWSLADAEVPQPADAWKNDLYSQYRDSRAVDETMNMLWNHDNITIKENMVSAIPAINLNDMLNLIYYQQGDAASAIEQLTPQWQAAVDAANGVKK
jgi:ABC-type glycerol-3-phosphate transport system substrate-binding protein